MRECGQEKKVMGAMVDGREFMSGKEFEAQEVNSRLCEPIFRSGHVFVMSELVRTIHKPGRC